MENLENKSFLRNVRAYGIFILTVYFCLISEVWSLLRVRHDLLLFIDNLQISVSVMSATLKFLIFCWKKKDISRMISAIKSDWLKAKLREEKEIMLRHARLTRRITIVGYFLIITLLIIVIILPCFGFSMRNVTNFTDPGEKPLPLQSHFSYDVTKKSNFLITYWLQGISLSFVAVYFTGIDCFFALLVLHICGQLQNLALHLTKLDKSEDFADKLPFCVYEHVRLIRLTKIVDKTLNLMLIGQLFTFTVLFCFLGFLFTKIIKEDGSLPIFRLIWLGGALSTALTQMFVYCLIGEILLSRCEEVYGVVCNCNWYVLPPTEARMLLLILIRARTPLYITAGKMFPMTLGMFCSIINTSLSYLSVLVAYS